ATSARAEATSSAAMGCMRADGNRTVAPSVENWAMPPTNSKNCVARTIVNGIFEALITFSWAFLHGNNRSPAAVRCQQLTAPRDVRHLQLLLQRGGFCPTFRRTRGRPCPPIRARLRHRLRPLLRPVCQPNLLL